jgi:hypothetical protein
MSMGNVELSGSQSSYYNQYRYGARGINAAGTNPNGANPFALSSTNGTRPVGTPDLSNPQKPKGTMAQLNQAIQPTTNPSKIDIGMNDPGTNANHESGNANRSQAQGQKAANSMDKGAGGMKIDDNTPGKALSEEVKQTQREVRDVGKETRMNKTKGGIAGMGAADDTGKLGSVSSSLNETGQTARRADMDHKKGAKLNIMSKIKDIASMAMNAIGKALEITGNALTTAGQALISAGKPLLSNPFTAAIGAAMIAAGTALKVAGKALKVAGKAIQKAAAAMGRVAKGMGKNASKLLKKSSQQVNKGKQKIQKARSTLQKIRESSRRKLAQAAKRKKTNGVGSRGIKPLQRGRTTRLDAASQKFKVNPQQANRTMVNKAGQGSTRNVGKSKTLDDFAQPNKGVNAMGNAKNSGKLKPAGTKPDPKATENLQSLKKLENEQSLLKSTNAGKPRSTWGKIQQGGKNAFSKAKTTGQNARTKAKAWADKHPKLVTAAKWGGGIMAGGYMANKMLGGQQEPDPYMGPVHQRQERFATQEEFDRHYGFDKPLDIPNYQSGYSQYYTQQRNGNQGLNPYGMEDEQGYNGNSLLSNNHSLFRPNLGYA